MRVSQDVTVLVFGSLLRWHSTPSPKVLQVMALSPYYYPAKDEEYMGILNSRSIYGVS